jgi:excinuclease ABC subunit A
MLIHPFKVDLYHVQLSPQQRQEVLLRTGNTVVVIEHNMDVIKTADWIIDLGPEGGNEGGWIVAEGTPEAESYTGQFLKLVL